MKIPMNKLKINKGTVEIVETLLVVYIFSALFIVVVALIKI
jgi:hypothetical protein